MSNQEQRYDEYLASYHFYPNSIGFRIVSSKAIEKFKNIQSFQLNQLVNGKFFFAQDRREILLLKYDMWSRWVSEIENLFIELHEQSSTIQPEDLEVVIELANKTAGKYEHIILDEHKHHFNDDFSKIWVEIHKAAYEQLIISINDLHGSYEEVFTSIVDLLCEALQYTLTEIHELNEIFKDPESETIFLVITPFFSRARDLGRCLMSNRLTIYKKYFNIKSVWLKNYTNHGLSQELIDHIEEAGVTVDYKRCLIE